MSATSSTTSPQSYLTSLLNKSLRVTTDDTRMFLGEFKCTDSDLNIILSHTYEYRMPSLTTDPLELKEDGSAVVQKMTSRYLGLVVVPGEHVTKIEVEEFASQVKK